MKIKVNLSDILKEAARSEWGRRYYNDSGEHNPPDVELQLDKNLPKIYCLGYTPNLRSGLVNLMENVNFHSESRKRKIRTARIDQTQIVELCWDGESLTPGQIAEINKMYSDGAIAIEKPERHGALIAGYLLGKIGGKVRIENFDGGIYVVRNVLELPIIAGKRASAETSEVTS